jgi:hypothetical protein
MTIGARWSISGYLHAPNISGLGWRKALLVCGITSSYASEVQANEPTPWVGIYERISAYGYELWIAVLAMTLWRHQGTQANVDAKDTQGTAH